MSIKSRNDVDRPEKIQVELPVTCILSNAFVLLRMGKRWAKDLDIDWDPIQEKAMSGDYENLLLTMDEAFGDHVVFIR